MMQRGSSARARGRPAPVVPPPPGPHRDGVASPTPSADRLPPRNSYSEPDRPSSTPPPRGFVRSTGCPHLIKGLARLEGRCSGVCHSKIGCSGECEVLLAFPCHEPREPIACLSPAHPGSRPTQDHSCAFKRHKSVEEDVARIVGLRIHSYLSAVFGEVPSLVAFRLT